MVMGLAGLGLVLGAHIAKKIWTFMFAILCAGNFLSIYT
jgi:hypothetical protein